MPTSENEQGLRQIIDLSRAVSIMLLLLHFYYYCYSAFQLWGFTYSISNRILDNIVHTGLYNSFNTSKLIALAFLLISLVGARGRRSEKLKKSRALILLFTGLVLYFASRYILRLNIDIKVLASVYMTVTAIAYLLILGGGTLLSRIIKIKVNKDIFNKLNESFPQEERLLKNEYSINLPARYSLKGMLRKSWINIINPFRGLLILGSPGSGKSYFIIQHIIKQHIEKGFSMLVYDFKFDELSKIAYNAFLKYKGNYDKTPAFFVINFDDLSHSNRCNPIDVSGLHDISDAAEYARTILFGLNREWINKQGDFFVESSVNFVTGLIWFLRNYQTGAYCTLPHVVELAQMPYDKLFSILRTEPQIEVLINPFITAYQNGANEQLEGQIASAVIGLGKLSSPQLYYILSGSDLSLNINDPEKPKILCIGNNPLKSEIYGAIISLYITSISRLLNRQGRHKSSLVFDEFPTIYFNGIDRLIATARSNKIATTIAVQDASQLKLYYGEKQADVVLNITGNVIAGQLSGQTAKQLSEKIGKINQEKQSLSVNDHHVSVTHSTQLGQAIPLSTISSLSSGEFVGIVADNPDQKIKLKAFCCEIINDHKALDKEQRNYEDLPKIADVDPKVVLESYNQIKENIKDLISKEMERMSNTPSLEKLIVKKK